MWWMLVGAAAGALAGGLSTWRQGERNKEALEKQKENAWRQYLYGKRYGDEQYAIQKREAAYQLVEQDRALREGVGHFTDQYNTMALSRAFGEQDARVGAASDIGGHLAAEGAGGTRGNAANELIRAYAAEGLERQIDLRRRQDAHTLAGAVTDANRTVGAINHERDSWEAGGWRYRQKEAQDRYNEDIAKLGQKNFDWQIGWSKPGFLDYFTGVLGGGSQGMGMANDLYSYNLDWKNMFNRRTA